MNKNIKIQKLQTKAMQQPATHKRLTIWLLSLLAIVLLSGFIQIAQANDDPQALLEKASREMITALNNNRDRIRQDPSVTQKLIEDILLPHLDFITASKYVLGSNWDSSTKKQKIGFIKAFRVLLLRFYSSALTEYLNSHEGKLDPNLMVFYKPADTSAQQLLVRSEVKPKSGTPVPINYKMHKTRKGWKIIDVSVEGVSVITTYKTSFASEIKQNGLDALISSLHSRNEKLRTAASS